ncbi:MAG: ATP-binding protein [Myxococcota bacterium]
MATPETVEFLSFRRTFTLLILLVVLPSAGLSGFGIVAIVNERAAVEKRLERVWAGRLAGALAELQAELAAATASESEDGLELTFNGQRLTDVGFTVDGEVHSRDARVEAAVRSLGPELAQLPARPVVFSVVGPQTMLLAAERSGERVVGARLSGAAVDELLEQVGARLIPAGEPARLALVPVKREAPEGVVARLVSGVSEVREAALGPRELASLSLPAPLQDFRLVAYSEGEDPVARASSRNRALYGVLLGVFYITLALGVIFTGRTLYREARLSRLKTDFVSLVSHELRTPLTSIRMFIEMLALGRVKGEEMQTVLDLLSRETTRLSEMIESVLDWARIESGRKQYQMERCGPQGLVDAAVAAFQAQHMGAPMNFTVEVAEGLPAVNVDRAAIGGALLNLLQNAFKYTKADKRIALRVRRDDGHVVFEVQDNGIGIPSREHRKIFERFYRVDDLLSRETEGSGLGLSIAQRIVQAHHGRISVDSAPNRGSTFRIHLPVAHE